MLFYRGKSRLHTNIEHLRIFLHIKFLLFVSLNILFGHSAFSQVHQHICADTTGKYIGGGGNTSIMNWYLDVVDGTPDFTDDLSGKPVSTDYPGYYMSTYSINWTSSDIGDHTISMIEDNGNCESSSVSRTVRVHAKPNIPTAVVLPIACNNGNGGLKVAFTGTVPTGLLLQTRLVNAIGNSVVVGHDWKDISDFTSPFNFAGLSEGDYKVHVRYTVGGEHVRGSVVSSDLTYTLTNPSTLVLSNSITNVTCAGGIDGAINLSVAGGESGALSFEGTSEGVNLTAAQSMNNINGFTVEGWVKFNSSNTYSSGNYSLFGQNNIIEFSVNSSGFYAWVNTSSTSFNTTHPFNNTTLNDDNWHHLALTGSKTELILYVDGVEVKNKPVSLGADQYSSGSPLDNPSIGTGVSSGGINNPFDGEIASVRFWTAERTDTEVKSGMNQRMIGSESGLMAAYQLDEGNGTLISGVGNNAPDLTLPSGVTWQPNAPIYSYSWTGPGGFTATSQDISDLLPGIYQVTVSNSNGCTINDNNIEVEVKPDNVDPVISNCPTDITVGACSNSVTWTAPTATDNCSVTLTSTHNSGDVFPIGATTSVTYTATDGAGNTALCSFDVTVLPEITISITADNNTICEGQPVTITASGGGGKLPYAYEFYLNGTLIVSSASYTVSGNQLSSSVFANGDEITTKLIDNNSCEKTSNKITVTVNDLPLPQDIEHN